MKQKESVFIPSVDFTVSSSPFSHLSRALWSGRHMQEESSWIWGGELFGFVFTKRDYFLTQLCGHTAMRQGPSILFFFFFRFTSGLCPTYLICNIFFCFSVFCYDECTVRYKQTVTTLAHKASRKSLYWMQRKFMVSATVKIMQITNCSIIKM